MPDLRHCEIWSDLEAAGGVRLAVFAALTGLVDDWGVVGETRLDLECPIVEPALAQYQARRVLRSVFLDDSVEEWRLLTKKTTRRNPAGLMAQLGAQHPVVDLGNALMQRVEANGRTVLDFEAGSLSPADLIDAFFLPSLVAAGFPFYARGVVDPTTPELLVFAGDSVLAGLLRLAEVTRTEFQLRRETTPLELATLTQLGGTAVAVALVAHGLATGMYVTLSGADQVAYNIKAPITVVDAVTFTFPVANSPASPATGSQILFLPHRYLLDLLTAIGSDATTLDVRAGGNLLAVDREESSVEQVTRMAGIGAANEFLHASIARARWQVTAIAGTTLTLADPAGGAGPIAFDDQFNDALDVAKGLSPFYLRKVNGTLVLVTDSIAATQQVVVASAAGIALNDVVEFRKNAAGEDITFLDAPSARAAYGVKLGKTERPDLPDTINLLANPAMRLYAGGGAPDSWAAVGTPILTRTATAGRWRHGGASCHVQPTTDGHGLDTPYAAIAPSAALPNFSWFGGFWIEAGAVRVHGIAGKAAVSVTSLNRGGTGNLIATAVTPAPHGLAVGDQVEVLGANQAAYNGIVPVATVISATSFTYVLPSDPGSAGTGTITCRKVWVLPQGAEGKAWSNEKQVWKDLGFQNYDLNALGALFFKVRIVQDGTTASDFYVDCAQCTQSTGTGDEPFIDGAGPTKLWQAVQAALVLTAAPAVKFALTFVDLTRMDATTWPFRDVILGGHAAIKDAEMAVQGTTRILRRKRDLLKSRDTPIELSSKSEDVTDALVRPRLPPRIDKPSDTFIDLAVAAYFTPVPSSPTNEYVRLTARPSTAQVFYILQDKGAAIPAVGGPGWLAYSTQFSVQQGAVDLQLSAYAVQGSAISRVTTWLIDRDTLPQVTLFLTEQPASKRHYSWQPDDDVRRVRLYQATGGDWPTAAESITITRAGSTATVTTAVPHRLVTGDTVHVSGAAQGAYNVDGVVTVLSPTQFTYPVVGTPATPATGTIIMTTPRGLVDETKFVCDKHVDPSGGGFDATGNPIAGGLTYDDASTLGASTACKAIAVPFNTDLVTIESLRGMAMLTIAGAAAATILGFTAVRTTNGSNCSGGSSAQITCSWTPLNVSDVTHDLELYVSIDGYAETLVATEVSPNSNTSKVVNMDAMLTTGKSDPTHSWVYSFKLKAGASILQQGTAGAITMKSSCAVF